MEELTAQVIQLIQDGRDVTKEYAPILSHHLVRFTMIKAWGGVAIAGLLFCISFYCFNGLRKQEVYFEDGPTAPTFARGVAFTLSLIGALSTLGHNLPKALEPVGYLVNKAMEQ